ncbi:uncharacterized protein RB166_018825 isoform 4-T4 [Leptodactylus fuscus]|uniref:uncharacterized protein LOC142183060 isoform X1 n=1 Tax=Leptodactylus fuscus TaxID=238119 RepID=UPI003F4EF97D
MGKDRNHVTENILKLTLEIIYLLTGEDYGPVKKSRKQTTSSSRPTVSGAWGTTQSPTREPAPHSLINEKTNKKILELTNKIIELLTGEVPIKFQDENGDSLMEEWDYFESEKDPNMNVKKETHQGSDSPADFSDDTDISGGSRSPSSSPDRITARYSSDGLDDHSPQNSIETPDSYKEPCPTKTKIYIRTQYTQYSPSRVKEESVSHTGENISNTDLYSSSEYSPNPYTYTKEESTSGKAENLTNSELCINSQQYADRYTPRDDNKDSFSGVKEEPASGDDENLMDHPLPSWIYTKSDNKFKKKEPMCYICVECGKNFPYKSHLVRHQKIHVEDRPYSCIECGKSFKLNSNLISHLRIHTGQKPFSCSACNKSFISKSELVKHARTHTGEKPYSCVECGRRFSRISNLIDHNKIHTGEKPHCCTECGKCFRRHSNLLSHQKTHTMEKVYSCSQCSAGFLTNSELLKHQKTHSEGNSTVQ